MGGKNGEEEHKTKETRGRTTGSIFAQTRRNIGDFRYYGGESRIRNRSKPILRRWNRMDGNEFHVNGITPLSVATDHNSGQIIAKKRASQENPQQE